MKTQYQAILLNGPDFDDIYDISDQFDAQSSAVAFGKAWLLEDDNEGNDDARVEIQRIETVATMSVSVTRKIVTKKAE